MKYINKSDEPLKIMEWKRKFKNKYGRQPKYEDLLISPLEEDCDLNFKFTNRGKIKPVDDNARARYTIETLQLDTPQLNHAREEAMWASGAMEADTEEECLQLIQQFDSRDENGAYAAFCDAILYHLKENLMSLR